MSCRSLPLCVGLAGRRIAISRASDARRWNEDHLWICLSWVIADTEGNSSWWSLTRGVSSVVCWGNPRRWSARQIDMPGGIVVKWVYCNLKLQGLNCNTDKFHRIANGLCDTFRRRRRTWLPPASVCNMNRFLSSSGLFPPDSPSDDSSCLSSPPPVP